MKFNRAFSMAEMMVVMLIAAVVLAASAPMMTRKVQHDQFRTDVFQVLNNDERNAVEFVAGDNQRIFMNTDREIGYVGIVPNGVTIPQGSVSIGNNTPENAAAFFTALGIGTSTGNQSVAIGYGAGATGESSIAIGTASGRLAAGTTVSGTTFAAAAAGESSVSLGQNANSLGASSIAIGQLSKTSNLGSGSIAIGGEAVATQEDAIAIGHSVGAKGENSIVIGTNGAYASGDNSVALGNGAQATADNSVAIGHGVVNTTPNRITLGTENSTVYIPGNLVVGRYALLGYEDGEPKTGNPYWTVLRYKTQDKANFHFRTIEVGKNSDDDMYWGPEYKSGWFSQVPGFPFKSCDRRLKNVGDEFKGGLEELSKLNFYHFTFKKDEKKTPHVGVMAQDLQKVFPDAVTADEDGWLHIRWDEMFYAVINAVKELNTKICALAEDVVKLKERTEENDKAQAEMIAQLMENVKTQDAIIKKQQEQIDELTKQVKNLAKSKEKRERN